MKKIEIIQEMYPDEELLVADGFDDAIIGYSDELKKVIYSLNACVDILMANHGLQYDEAIEFFVFSVQGSFIGDESPLFINTI